MRRRNKGLPWKVAIFAAPRWTFMDIRRGAGFMRRRSGFRVAANAEHQGGDDA
jgi:hypothetical protein